jgi:NTE family protein
MSDETPVPAGAVPAQITPPGTPDAGPNRRLDLVLEGGGVKGIGLAAAVIELAEAGYTFPRVAGTSAGAIAAALIAALNAAGKPMTMLTDILDSVEYPKFMESGRVRAAGNLLLHMGLYDGDYLVEWLGDALAEIGPTVFGDLRDVDTGADRTLTAAQRYSLVVHTADITRGRCVRLPWDYPVYGRPDIDSVPIVDAVRASMSIPFFFEPVRFSAPTTEVDGVTYEKGEVLWVDGGLLSNFPVEVFDRGDGAPARWPTLGVKLSARQTTITAATDVDSVFSEALASLHTLLDNADRYYLTPDKASRTVFVDNAGLKATDFHLSKEQQALLYANGTAAARAWLAAPTGGATQTGAAAQAGAAARPLVAP